MGRGQRDDVLDREVLAGLRPAAWVLATLYAGFGLAHNWFLPEPVRLVMVTLTWSQAVILLGILAFWKVWPPRRAHAHAWMLALGVLALANSGALLVLLDEPKQATNLLFLMMGGGFLLLRRAYFVAYAALVAAVFAYEVATGPPSPDWIHYGFGILSAAALAVVVHIVHVRSTLRFDAARRQAERSERHVRTILTGAPLVLFALDAEGRFTLAEGQGLAGLHLRSDDLLGKTIFDLYSHNPKVVASARNALGGALGTVTVEEAGRLFDVVWTPRPDGGVVGVATDVTDRRQAEIERERANEEAREAQKLRDLERLRTTFINTAAHELNTPLTPIRLQLAMLERLDESGRAKSAEILRRNVERLHRIVRDLLTMARLQEGRLEVRPRPFDLTEAARQTVETFAEPARQSGVGLDLVAPERLEAWGEPDRVQQVLDNLVANAVKFTPAGGQVKVRLAQRDGMAVAEVEDTGVGMEPQDAAGLFQPFVQLEEGRQRGGTGLGLHLSKAIVEAHGGRVWATSRGRGQGATFGFEVPRQGNPGGDGGRGPAS